jgi:hypothetical protein
MNITHHKNGEIKTLEEETPNTQLLYIVCLDCGKRVTGDSIHTCSPQLKTLTDEEIIEIRDSCYVESGLDEWEYCDIEFARAILRKAQEK